MKAMTLVAQLNFFLCVEFLLVMELVTWWYKKLQCYGNVNPAQDPLTGFLFHFSIFWGKVATFLLLQEGVKSLLFSASCFQAPVNNGMTLLSFSSSLILFPRLATQGLGKWERGPKKVLRWKGPFCLGGDTSVRSGMCYINGPCSIVILDVNTSQWG